MRRIKLWIIQWLCLDAIMAASMEVALKPLRAGIAKFALANAIKADFDKLTAELDSQRQQIAALRNLVAHQVRG
jgi:hypothetical protein